MPLANDSASAPPFQADRVLAIAAGHALHDTYTGFLAPLLPVFITNLALSRTQAGLLMLFLQGPSLLQPLIGHIADHVNLHYMIYIGPAAAAVGMSLLGIMPNYALLALLLLAVGTSSAAFHSVAPAIAGQLSGRRLGQGMGWWMVGAEFGRTLGPLLLVSAIQLLSLRRTPWLMLLGLLGATILYVRVRGISTQPSIGAQEFHWGEALRVTGPLLLPIAGITITRAFMLSALTTYLPTFLREQGAALWIGGAALSALQATGTLGALTAGSLSDQFGRREVLIISLLTSPLLMLAFLVTNGGVQFLLLLVLGFVAMAVNPVFMALVQESFPDRRAMANGMYLTLLFLSNSLTSVAVGALGDRFGLRWAFTASAIAPLLGLPLIWLLPRGEPHSTRI